MCIFFYVKLIDPLINRYFEIINLNFKDFTQSKISNVINIKRRNYLLNNHN